MTAKTGNAGFTLIELVASITLIGLIAVIVTASLRLGLSATGQGEKRIESLERLRASFQLLEAQVTSQFPHRVEEDGEKKVYFTGSADAMRFATTYSLWDGPLGYAAVSYRIRGSTEDGFTLAAGEQVIGTERVRETSLFGSAEQLSFSYYYRDPSGPDSGWQEEWTDRKSLPERIRLNILSGGKDYSMTFPVRVSTSSSSAVAQAPGGVPENLRMLIGK